jgi:hypothetical protein
VSFVMRTKGEKNKKGITIYSLDIPAKSFEIISKEDFTKFGTVYSKLVASFAQEDSEKAAGLTNIQGIVNKDIDAAISGDEGVAGDDETVEI